MGFYALREMLWLIYILGLIGTMVFWLVVMHKAMDQISHDFRKMEPGAVWLGFIPFFGFIWQFLVMNAVAEGLARELQSRNMFPREPKPGYSVGVSGCILICCSVIPFAGVLFGLIGIVLLIVHAVRISEYNRALAQSGRWEIRYQQRMQQAAQQQQFYFQQMQQHPQYNSYQQPQTFTPPAPVIPPTYTPEPTRRYMPKEKPKNPFE
jgi:hypothetical protein